MVEVSTRINLSSIYIGSVPLAYIAGIITNIIVQRNGLNAIRFSTGMFLISLFTAVPIPDGFCQRSSYNPWARLLGGQKDTLHLPLSPIEQLVWSSPITRADLDTCCLKHGNEKNREWSFLLSLRVYDTSQTIHLAQYGFLALAADLRGKESCFLTRTVNINRWNAHRFRGGAWKRWTFG